MSKVKFVVSFRRVRSIVCCGVGVDFSLSEVKFLYLFNLTLMGGFCVVLSGSVSVVN